MDKIYAAARALAVLVAIVGAFVHIPYAVSILLVLGAVASFGVAAEDRTRVYVVAVLLSVGAASLAALPVVGTALATIFANLGTAYVGVAVTAVATALLCKIKSDWT